MRGRQSRVLTEVTRIGLDAAAEKIQTSYRSHHRQLQKSTSVGVRSVAARLIQHLVRGYLHKQSKLHQAVISEERSEVRHIAATSLQRFWRQITARRELLLEEQEAATCIQALGRGHLARRSYQSLRDSASQVGLSKPVRVVLKSSLVCELYQRIWWTELGIFSVLSSCQHSQLPQPPMISPSMKRNLTQMAPLASSTIPLDMLST